MEKILVVREFPDVFPKELPGIPPKREVNLSIEIVPETARFLGHLIEWLLLN